MTSIGVITFPGSLDDVDAQRAIRLAGATPVPLWHGNDTLGDVDAVILPGGFSYGDYLRCGAIARFSPIMSDLITRAEQGLPVLGVCNGFQILCEAHLLPGALIRNDVRTFVCRDQRMSVVSDDTVWTSAYTRGEVITIVLKNGEGGYVADPETLARIEGEDQVVFRYLDTPDGKPANPNGSMNDIAGVTNARGNVVGLMPHPEHNVDPLTSPSTDGTGFFRSVISFIESSTGSRSLAGVG